ncbi:hypothetical protein LPB72_17535 [Hydrogenophaga crassostreae]|uniref:ATPase AAA-type core domain-containing protein n=1 Tax=Hydrogenophaga crassostreae TaxID=1763535 RepID=A0A167GXC3_9BURK|nr:ATP-binding protein [Hydrogenophaga crassostreae]AOW12801.1 hypothetical protein LPB072_08040 [Hydrogenophaga crassostreae]OAD39989.1 hypothetical protein LPB72_17535 [Hydrogenophaga crassostreae]
MLLRFGVENHGSIESYQELQLTATSLKDDESGLIPVASETAAGIEKALKVVPVLGIYGANASGKSTLLSAMEFFGDGIVSSHTGRASSSGTPYYPFLLNESSKEKPSRYDADIVLDGYRYHYGYSLDGKKIVQEWLYSFDLSAPRQVRSVLFARETNSDLNIEFKFGKALKGENKQIAKLVRPNSLFLSAAAQNSHPQITPIFEFFFSKVVHRLDSKINEASIAEQITAYFGADEGRQKMAIEFLKAADIGVNGIDFSKSPPDKRTAELLQDFEQVLKKHLPQNEENFEFPKNVDRPKVELLHIGKDRGKYPIKLKRESTGTLALLQLLGPAFARLNEGGLLIVDELNTALHPLVSRELIKLFSSPDTNIGKSQLIFSTHDTNLLSGGLLRRDQLWFTEKDLGGATHVYALSDIKVRATDNFEQGYLEGRFGATPFMGCSLKDFVRTLHASTAED